MERRWRSGDRGDVSLDTRIVIDAEDCRLIECAWAGLVVLREKAFLWLHYRQQWAPRRVLFILADMPGPLLYPNDWGRVYEDAHHAIEQALIRGSRGNSIVMPHCVGVDIFPAVA